jgi:hypothetical protein
MVPSVSQFIPTTTVFPEVNDDEFWKEDFRFCTVGDVPSNLDADDMNVTTAIALS